MAQLNDMERIQRVAAALASEDYPRERWVELPESEQHRFIKKARAFIAAHEAAQVRA